MSYKNLYDYCQGLSPKVSRKCIKSKLLEVTGKEKIAMAVSSSLDPNVCRGLFLSVDADHKWAKQHGSDVVVVSRAIVNSNECWDRFISVKEMMHVFDTEIEACDTGEKFDQLINEWSLNTNATPMMNSEIKCFWRGIALFCPEAARKVLKAQIGKTLTPYDVALQLRIPEQYIAQLFHDRYEEWVGHLLTE